MLMEIGKQRRPWSDCFFRSSLILVCTVCWDLSVPIHRICTVFECCFYPQYSGKSVISIEQIRYVVFGDEWQTVQTLIRLLLRSSRIRVHTIFADNLSKYLEYPKYGSWKQVPKSHILVKFHHIREAGWFCLQTYSGIFQLCFMHFCHGLPGFFKL